MILKKPYAFLIKHFKLINLIISGLSIYMALVLNDMIRYFNNYISQGWYTYQQSASSHTVSIYTFIVLGLLVLISITVYALMRFKDKPRLFYMIVITVTIIMLFMIPNANGTLNVMALKALDSRSVRFTRDLLFIGSLCEYIIILITIFRGLGFDIKKFDFKSIKEDFNIEDKDQEEFELTIGIDTNEINRQLRRSKRKLRYFILENKTKIFLITIFLLTVISGTILLNNNVFNRTYKLNNVLSFKGFNITINNIYLSNKDYQNNIINQDNKSYIVLDVTFNNTMNKTRTFDANDLVLSINDNRYSPIISNKNNFLDIGPMYQNEKLNNNQNYNYIVVYKIDNYNKNKLKLELGDKYYKLNYIDLDHQKQMVTNINLNDKLLLADTVMKKGDITIKGYEIADSFIYDYEVCSDYDCIMKHGYLGGYTLQDMNLVLVKIDMLSHDLDLRNSAFIGNFGKINYQTGDTTKTLDLIDYSPGNYSGSYAYLAVLKNVQDLNNMELVITLRNHKYIYKLK